ncbi:hypothetical protein [Lutibacter sp.]|uniref:hypothetical protein n=1 Tax=Lutibacter sp. TaxID=1925666 RepID=UPI001A195562|nr:hypothetical protein [Lutibacter sp.]MBI9040117.1 hypothetical protein [Lutibacter sp.]
MKKANLKIFITTLHVMFFMSFSAQAQVGIGTTSPDASSMLDIQSPDNDKGVLIPRMTTAQRTAITTLANGLLVFDTTTKSFWFYNGTATTPAWKELVSGSSIVDADGDTKVEVEKVTDTDPNGDEINFTTRNVQRMKIDANGVIIMGDSTASNKNYTKITTDGSLSYVGEATRWDDLKVPVNSVKIKNITEGATWEQFISGSGLSLLFFKEQTDANKVSDVVFTVQMPHAWKQGTAIYPHVHWTVDDAVGDKRVSWGLEYVWVNVGQQFNTSPSIVYGNGLATPNGTLIEAREHVITPLTSIISTTNGPAGTLSSMLVCRLFRNSSVSADDTYTGSVGLLEIDFHYQIDSDGSNTEYGKTN